MRRQNVGLRKPQGRAPQERPFDGKTGPTVQAWLARRLGGEYRQFKLTGEISGGGTKSLTGKATLFNINPRLVISSGPWRMRLGGPEKEEPWRLG